MATPRSDKTSDNVLLKPNESVSGGVPAFSFDSPNLDDEVEVNIGLPSIGVMQQAGSTVSGIDLDGVPKIIFAAGRGKTGKTTALRWMAETALLNGHQVLMGDIDPTNASFSTYFQGVHKPVDADNPVATLKWLEQFIQHAIRHRMSAQIDLGGGDTTLRRLVAELPNLVSMLTEEGIAPVLLYMVGPQVDDLSPIATMAERGFHPEATAIVMNEAAVEPGLSRDAAFARIHRHSVFRDALIRGAVPIYMPRLLVAEAIEARRMHFIDARDGGTGTGKAPLGAFDRARVRNWLEAMDRQFAGIRSWMP